MKKRLVTLLLLLVCCLAWANCAWAAEQSGQRSLPQLSKIEIRHLLDAAPQSLNGAALFAEQPKYTVLRWRAAGARRLNRPP